MANVMRTYITIKNVDSNVIDRFNTWLNESTTTDEGNFIPTTTQTIIDPVKLYNDLYDESFEPDAHPDYSWMVEHVGPKWMMFEYDYVTDTEIKFNTESAWSVPFDFIETLTRVLTGIKEDVYITGVFEDESYDPCGAFVYGYDYDDTEDYDEEIEYDKLWEDDEYRDRFYEELFQMEVDLEEYYLEQLNND